MPIARRRPFGEASTPKTDPPVWWCQAIAPLGRTARTAPFASPRRNEPSWKPDTMVVEEAHAPERVRAVPNETAKRRVRRREARPELPPRAGLVRFAHDLDDLRAKLGRARIGGLFAWVLPAARDPNGDVLVGASHERAGLLDPLAGERLVSHPVHPKLPRLGDIRMLTRGHAGVTDERRPAGGARRRGRARATDGPRRSRGPRFEAAPA